MLAKVMSYGLTGIQGFPVEVQVDINAGLPGYDTVGLPDAAIRESKERIRSAIKNSGFHFPMDKITVNLAPADTKKEGPLYDLAIALGVLSASEQLDYHKLGQFVVVGELSLDGNVRHVNGVLPLLIAARDEGYTHFLVPIDNVREASFLDGIEVYAVEDLRQAVHFFMGELLLYAAPKSDYQEYVRTAEGLADFADVRGQEAAKRAIEIAVSGGHNLLMMGPPGSGKTLLSRCIVSIMPDMSFEEALEVTKIHSVSGELDVKKGIVCTRPFRSPHHTATMPALVGGGKDCRPGEISMAHNGVLFLDEMPEYSRYTLETLRQPLESGTITISRASGSVEYPARFMLVASMNPCPCGNYGSHIQECRCSSNDIKKYRARLSGPLLDRIDLHIEVDSVSFQDLTSTEKSTSSAEIKKRVAATRAVQANRFLGTQLRCNSDMGIKEVKTFCNVSEGDNKMLEKAFDTLKLSARGYTRILKVARTIADMDGSSGIERRHLSEAIQYRSMDRKYW